MTNIYAVSMHAGSVLSVGVMMVYKSDKYPCSRGVYSLWPCAFTEQVHLTANCVPDVVLEIQR